MEQKQKEFLASTVLELAVVCSEKTAQKKGEDAAERGHNPSWENGDSKDICLPESTPIGCWQCSGHWT